MGDRERHIFFHFLYLKTGYRTQVSYNKIGIHHQRGIMEYTDSGNYYARRIIRPSLQVHLCGTRDSATALCCLLVQHTRLVRRYHVLDVDEGVLAAVSFEKF